MLTRNSQPSIVRNNLTGSNTKKTLQELSKIFNRLASELTTELGHALVEIERLRKEVHTIKRGSHSPPTTSKANPARKNTGKSGRHVASRSSSTQQASQGKKTESIIPNTDSEYIFPREPFNPPAPKEPTPPNN